MSLLFAYRRYRLPLRVAVRTSHGVWREREGVILRLQDERGRVGFGEAAPIPWFGTESPDEIEGACRGLGERVDLAALAAVPGQLGCLRHALAAAQDELRANAEEAPWTSPDGVTALTVAALLPAGRAALEAVGPRADAGFRVFKWKVGVADVADELVLLDDLCAALPAGAKLRLDANGGWTRPQAERWLERCAERPVDYVEQPCFADATQGATQRKRCEDVLRGLAEDYPTPIALDESLVGDGDLGRWLENGWSGVFVIKPALLADVAGALERLAQARAAVVFSSALETAVGARDALRAAFEWRGERRALGFGVYPLFKDGRFDGPAAAPFVYRDDVARLDAEAAWNALT
ncbi:MAG TPA: o-succinylbenzoate synthase [Opitutus sp.]|nr:o-succinylbenzoate synthase [Opitutus sp.]